MLAARRALLVILCVAVPCLFASCPNVLKQFYPQVDYPSLTPFMQRVYVATNESLIEIHPELAEVSPPQTVRADTPSPSPDRTLLATYDPNSDTLQTGVAVNSNLLMGHFVVHEWKHRSDNLGGYDAKVRRRILWPLSPLKSLEVRAYDVQQAHLRKIWDLESYSGQLIDELTATLPLTPLEKKSFTLFSKKMSDARALSTLADPELAKAKIREVARELSMTDDEVDTLLIGAINKFGYQVDFYLSALHPRDDFLELNMTPYQKRIRAEQRKALTTLLAIAAPVAMAGWALHCVRHPEDKMCQALPQKK